MQTICIMMSVCGALSPSRALRYVQKYVICHVSVHPGVASREARLHLAGFLNQGLLLLPEAEARAASARNRPATHFLRTRCCSHTVTRCGAMQTRYCHRRCCRCRCRSLRRPLQRQLPLWQGRGRVARWQGGRAAHRVKADLRAVGTPFSGSSFHMPLVLNLVTSST